MDPTGVVTVISLLSATGKKPVLLRTWRKNELVDGNVCLRKMKYFSTNMNRNVQIQQEQSFTDDAVVRGRSNM